MLQITPKHRIFVAVDAVDFRAGIDGLAALCRHQINQDPMSGHVFMFCNRKKTAIKALVYDSQGFWLCHKRLSKGKFKHWPTSRYQTIEMTVAALQVLLYNGDPKSVDTAPPWQPIH